MEFVTTFIFSICLILGNTSADYWSDREDILAKEASNLIGSSIVLTEKEQTVNEILMEHKLKEYDEGFADASKFLPSFHFFKTKSAIQESEVFKIIQMVPKGASLHSHSSAMVSSEFLFNMTYYDNLYGCDNNGTFKLSFFFNTVDNTCEWKLLSDWRKQDEHFDDFLKDRMTLVVDDPDATYSDINVIWDKFESIFSLVSDLFNYRRFLHDYLYQVLQEFYDDNVMYLEIRGSFGPTFDENGTIYEASETPQFYLDTMANFRKTNPDFVGFKIIYSKSRKADDQTMKQYLDEYFKFQEQYPELIAGFDMIGQEDKGRPLVDFVSILEAASSRTKFFFHAGETNWNGASTDLNLVDAVLLNTSRIGHGFAISKHTEVLKLVKERNIPIELNPLSNQVLKLVDDIRNHVGTSLIAAGYPVVITCDDPSFWGAKGLSYDWYLAFMGMTPRNGDLRILKQLALNSLIYSSLSEDVKPDALAIFYIRWNDFLNEVLNKYL